MKKFLLIFSILLFSLNINSQGLIKKTIFSDNKTVPEEVKFITSWNITNGDIIVLPLTGVNNVQIEWGDGTITNYNGTLADKTHQYLSTQIFDIKINGTLDIFSVDNDGSIDTKILEIKQWGAVSPSQYSFYGCENMVVTATDIPDTTNFTNLSELFRNCDAITTIPNFNNWDVGHIESFTLMIDQCLLANPDVSSWDVSSGRNFSGMLASAAFNQDISGWTFDTLIGINMSGMFSTSAFNQDISGWDVSKVTNMTSMFLSTSAFNQNINGWDVINVEDMTSMFENNNVFNQPLNLWDVGNVTKFTNMFEDADAFNQDISDWDVSSSTSLQDMFRDTSIYNNNGVSLNSWDVSNVTLFASMFQGSNAFNQDVDGWTINSVSNVNMGSMFRSCNSFNQSLAGWNMSKVISLTDFLEGANGLSTANYDATLISWDAQILVSGLTPHFGSSTYTLAGAGGTAKTSIETNDLWVFIDGGGI